MIKMNKFSRLINKIGYSRLKGMEVFSTTSPKILVMPTLIPTWMKSFLWTMYKIRMTHYPALSKKTAICLIANKEKQVTKGMILTKIQSKKWKINFLINNLIKVSEKEDSLSSQMGPILSSNMLKIFNRLKNLFKKECI